MKYQFKYAFDDRMITALGYEPEGQTILVVRLVMLAIMLAEKNHVIFVTDDSDAKNLFEQTVCGNGEFGNDDEVVFIEPEENINIEANKKAWLEWSRSLNMQYSYMIINPPYAIGNKIIAEVIKYLRDDGKAVVIQPLSQYKHQKLFEHIEKFELADPKLFEDTADITKNLNISVVTKNKQNKFSWQELVLESCDQNFRKFYDWNIVAGKHYFMRQIRDNEVQPENIDLHHQDWFIETIKCSAHDKHQGGFGKEGTWYKWNMTGATGISNAYAGVIEIAGHALENFKQYWYNKAVGEGLASIVIAGINMDNFVGTGYFAIPQIDWETIDQHPLWNTDVDAAVLDTMGLKWDDDKTKIIDK